MAKKREDEDEGASEQTRQELEVLDRAPPATPDEDNPFVRFGKSATRRNIAGRLMKFSKGDYSVEDEEIPLGSKFVAVMDELHVGWVKWVDGRVEDQVMGRVHDRFVVPPRENLGDLDEAEWGFDPSGRPRDPWQKTYYVVLKDLGKPLTADMENCYTLPLNSDGGRQAVEALSYTYGKAMRQRPDEWPVVELAVSSYQHPQFGKIKKPILKMTEEWERKQKTK
jgi:hypothetical protein